MDKIDTDRQHSVHAHEKGRGGGRVVCEPTLVQSSSRKRCSFGLQAVFVRGVGQGGLGAGRGGTHVTRLLRYRGGQITQQLQHPTQLKCVKMHHP